MDYEKNLEAYTQSLLRTIRELTRYPPGPGMPDRYYDSGVEIRQEAWSSREGSIFSLWYRDQFNNAVVMRGTATQLIQAFSQATRNNSFPIGSRQDLTLAEAQLRVARQEKLHEENRQAYLRSERNARAIEQRKTAPEPRIGRAERDEAIGKIGDAFAAERLTLAELHERTDKVARATTQRGLDALTADIPLLPARQPEVKALPPPVKHAPHLARWPYWYIAALTLLVIAILLVH